MKHNCLYGLVPMALAAFVLSAQPAYADQTRSGIEAADTQFSAAVGKGDSKAIGELYTTDAQLFTEGHDPIKGTAAIQKFFQGAIESGVAAVTFKTVEVYGHGLTATEIGDYELRDKAGKSLDHGKYIVMWRHQNGRWKLFRDIFTSSVPPKKP